MIVTPRPKKLDYLVTLTVEEEEAFLDEAGRLNQTVEGLLKSSLEKEVTILKAKLQRDLLTRIQSKLNKAGQATRRQIETLLDQGGKE